MKQFSKKILKFLLFGSIFVTLSCEVQENYNENNKRNILVEDFSLRSIQGKTSSKLLEVANKIKSLNTKATNGRTVYNSQFNFYMDDEHGKHIVVDGQDSYTFEITRPTGDHKVENIVFNEKQNGGFDTYFLKYDLTKEEFNTLPQTTIASRNKELDKVELSTASTSRTCYEIEIYVDPRQFKLLYVIVEIPCEGGGSGGYGGWGEQGGDMGNNTGGTNTGTNSGDSGTSGNSGNQYGNTSSGPINPTTTHWHGGINTTPVVGQPPTPCEKLNNLFDPLKADIIPKVNNLFMTIPQSIGENAEVFSNSPTGYNSSTTISQTGSNTIQTPVGNNIFAIIHTHPLDTYPMFSWTDVNQLNNLNNNLDPQNYGQAVNMLATIDDNGVNQLYAIVFNNESSNTIADLINTPKYSGCSDSEVAAELDDELDDRFRKENNSGTFPNFERAFLRQMFGYNVSLYRANAALNNWSKIRFNSVTGQITTLPCN
jgi:hypothetical protein